MADESSFASVQKALKEIDDLTTQYLRIESALSRLYLSHQLGKAGKLLPPSYRDQKTDDHNRVTMPLHLIYSIYDERNQLINYIKSEKMEELSANNSLNGVFNNQTASVKSKSFSKSLMKARKKTLKLGKGQNHKALSQGQSQFEIAPAEIDRLVSTFQPLNKKPKRPKLLESSVSHSLRFIQHNLPSLSDPNYCAAFGNNGGLGSMGNDDYEEFNRPLNPGRDPMPIPSSTPQPLSTSPLSPNGNQYSPPNPLAPPNSSPVGIQTIIENIGTLIPTKYRENFFRSKLTEAIPLVPVLKLKGRALTTMLGPDRTSADTFCYTNYVSAATVSSFPSYEDQPLREGDPICDQFSIKLYENRICAVLADGNYRGARARKAAKRASKNFVNLIEATHQHVRHLQDASHIMLEGYNLAHHSIVSSLTEARNAGNASLLTGILFEVNRRKSIEFSQPLLTRSFAAEEDLPPDGPSSLTTSGESDNGVSSHSAEDARWLRRTRQTAPVIDMKDLPGWVFLCCQLGNNKAFHYNPANGQVNVITPCEKAPGNLGSNEGEDKPNLNGLSLIPYPCEKGDVIIMMSDGCHNNFNPLQLGKKPDEVGLTGVDPSLSIEELSDICSAKELQELLAQDVDVSRPLSVKGIVDRIINKVMTDTAELREHRRNTSDLLSTGSSSSSQSPTRSLPNSCLGHVTCIAFVVSPITLSYNEWMKK